MANRCDFISHVVGTGGAFEMRNERSCHCENVSHD